jgi:hypothetical protein
MDAGVLIKFAVIFLIFVVPAIGQFLAKIRQAQQQQQRQQQRPQPPASPPPPRRPVPKEVSEEIDEFLRRAAQRRSGQQQPRPVGSSSPVSPVPAPQPVKAEVVAEMPVGGQVNEHVKKYLDAEEFARREAQLGEQVAQKDRQIDEHLHQVFDHNLSELAAVPGETATEPVAVEPAELFHTAETEAAAELTAASDSGLAVLLGSADSIRQAIVLSEIIQRPEQRWE